MIAHPWISVPGKSLHEIARGPTYYPLLLNGEDHNIVRLKPHLRSWLIAVMRDGAMFAVEAHTRSACLRIMRGYLPLEIAAYLIYVRPKHAEAKKAAAGYSAQLA